IDTLAAALSPRALSERGRLTILQNPGALGSLRSNCKKPGITLSVAIRQRPDEVAYRLLLLLAPNLSKIASDLKQHPLVRYDLARTFPTKTFVKIGERHAQRAGNLK